MARARESSTPDDKDNDYDKEATKKAWRYNTGAASTVYSWHESRSTQAKRKGKRKIQQLLKMAWQRGGVLCRDEVSDELNFSKRAFFEIRSTTHGPDDDCTCVCVCLSSDPSFPFVN